MCCVKYKYPEGILIDKTHAWAKLEAGAGIYSIVETAKANHLNPFWYFAHLLTVLPELHNMEP